MADTAQPITINGEPMRICWGSNSPLVRAGGYGSQTGLIVPRLRDRLGIDVSISAFYGHYGGKITWQGIDIYSGGFDHFGNDIHAANAHQSNADLLLTHQDCWVQNPSMLTAKGMRWVSWPPIDSEPIAPQIALRLQPEYCYQPITLSHFGQKQALAAGLDSRLIVQGIDTNTFTPGSKAEAREKLGWSQDAFYVGMVAHNRGYPNRKAYPQQLEAFGKFYQRHKDARLYIHAYSDPSQDPEAVPLLWHLARYGAELAVEFVRPFDLNMGAAVEHMVDLYRAFDVLLCAGMSEGFGIPLIESQSCGTPVITGAWTAMEENCYAGWLVAKEDSEPWFVSPLECEWRLPHIGAIVERLEMAYTLLQVADNPRHLAERGRSAVIANHDQDMLIDTQWRAVLTELAARIEAEPIPWHRHQWAPYGHQNGRGIVQPCLVQDCPAERAGEAVAPGGFPLIIDGIELDIEDDVRGGQRYAIASEIETVYHLHELTFRPGDVVIDIGAHVGIVSCYLAKKWPEIAIYAFEPITANFDRLERNIAANGLANVYISPLAITSDGRDLELSGDPAVNTGHYSAFAERGPFVDTAPSMTIAELLWERKLERIALLKLDCEGAEYEILHSLGALLGKADAIVMEVHENERLRAEWGSGAQLVEFARLNVPHVRASVIAIPDAEEVIHGER